MRTGIDGTQHVRPAANRNIELTADQPVDLAPLRIEPAMMRHQFSGRVAQRLDRVHQPGIIGVQIADTAHRDQHAQCRLAIGGVGCKIPAPQHGLGLGHRRIASEILGEQFIDQTRDRRLA